MQNTILDIEMMTIDGEVTSPQPYSGNALSIVNVAPKCGLTPQYEQLENLQKAQHQQGSSVLGFPCNQLLGQEPGSEEEIKMYCNTTWDVTFPTFSKIDTNGEGRHPLYQKLTDAVPTVVAPADDGLYERMASKGRASFHPDDIPWNFEKFLVGCDGKVLQRFSSDTTPEDPILVQTTKQALAD